VSPPAPPPALAVPDAGSLQGDLQVLAGRMAALLAEPPAAQVAVFSAAACNQDLATHAQGFFTGSLAGEAQVFERAKARGGLPPDTDPMLLMDLASGAIWTRAVLRQLPLEPGFTRQLVGAVLQGAPAGPRTP
jgi:hypothetical protein